MGAQLYLHEIKKNTQRTAAVILKMPPVNAVLRRIHLVIRKQRRVYIGARGTEFTLAEGLLRILTAGKYSRSDCFI